MSTSTIIAIAGFLLTLVIQVFSAGIFIGGLAMAIKFLKELLSTLKEDTAEHFRRLEYKQDKHNGLIERMTVVEQSIKAAHHRIDDIKE